MAKMPPKIKGCKVFTLPSSMLGYLVISATSVTGTLPLRKNSAVPPVEIILMPSFTSPLANGSNPVLSETESNAYLTFSSNSMALNFQFPFGKEIDRFRIKLMFLLQDAGGQAFFGIVF